MRVVPLLACVVFEHTKILKWIYYIVSNICQALFKACAATGGAEASADAGGLLSITHNLSLMVHARFDFACRGLEGGFQAALVKAFRSSFSMSLLSRR